MGHLLDLAGRAEVRPEDRDAALLSLVERVAAHYRTPPDEVAQMKRLALADRAAAWECFTADLESLAAEFPDQYARARARGVGKLP